MTDTSKPLVSRFKVGRYTCTLTLPMHYKRGDVGGVGCEWEPRVPKRLTDAELHQYCAARDRAFAEWSALTGVPVLVVEA